MVLSAGKMFWGCHTLVPAINYFFTDGMCPFKLFSKTKYNLKKSFLEFFEITICKISAFINRIPFSVALKP